MDGYTTGGNRGDGTVFALDIYEVRLARLSPLNEDVMNETNSEETDQNLIFAGTRFSYS
jgi:hypothetical protein